MPLSCSSALNISYGPRVLKLIGDAQRYGADLVWLDGDWWFVLSVFPTYRGVRFRVVNNRLHLLPAVKDFARA